MVQQKLHNGRSGHMLSQKDIDRMEKIIENGKVKYFIPALKPISAESLDKKMIADFYSQGKKNKDIAEHLGKSLTWLNTRLMTLFGTSAQSKIMEELNKQI